MNKIIIYLIIGFLLISSVSAELIFYEDFNGKLTLLIFMMFIPLINILFLLGQHDEYMKTRKRLK